MPKVKNPLFSQEARGGIGGLVYNTWRGISYVKTNTSPTGQGTQKRLAAQARLTTVSKVWQTIGDVSRAAWAQYAIDHPVTSWTGAPLRLTGMNYFVMLNAQLDLMGGTPITTPPAIPIPDATTGLTLLKTGTDLMVDWTLPTTTGKRIICFLTGPHSKGVTAKVEQAQLKTVAIADAVGAVVLFADAPIGRYTCFAKVGDFTNGLTSTWTSKYFDMT